MTWIERNLGENEELRVVSKPHWLYLFTFGRLVLYLFTLGLWAIYTYYQRETHEIAVTNRRLVVSTGILTKNVVEFKLPAIESVQVKQTLAGRMMNFGTVRVNGNGEDSFVFVDVADPWAIQRAAQA